MESKQLVHFDFNNMMADTIGSEHGVTEQELQALEPLAAQYVHNIKQERARGELKFLDLPYDRSIVAEILETVSSLKNKFRNLVIVGIGGSALGNIAIHTALNHPFHNMLGDKERCGSPRIFVLDNIDPDKFSGFMDVIKPEETLFTFITKSGTTIETMSQFLIITNLLHGRLGEGYRKHVITITDSEKGTLRKLTKHEDFMSFSIPSGIGGRYSVLTPVGLFSAAMGGIEISDLLNGAALMDRACQSDNLWENPALMSAALYYLNHIKKGKNILVMMPYSSALSGMADWFCQLWAESLGKKFSLDKKVIYTGSTPVRATGVVDQHSQLQLYMEGPYDKVITFCALGQFKKHVSIIGEEKVDGDLTYLKGYSLDGVMRAEFEGTRLALTEQSRPNCTIVIDALSAFTLGQLLYFFELQTAYGGTFYQVNAFDQPGVEAGKINTFAIMGKEGFVQRKREISIQLQRASKKYCI